MTMDTVFGQMEAAKQHTDRARAMITAAVAELDQANILIRYTMSGSANQRLAAMIDRTQQDLTSAAQGTTVTTTAIDETLARWRGTAGPGNWPRAAATPTARPQHPRYPASWNGLRNDAVPAGRSPDHRDHHRPGRSTTTCGADHQRRRSRDSSTRPARARPTRRLSTGTLGIRETPR